MSCSLTAVNNSTGIVTRPKEMDADWSFRGIQRSPAPTVEFRRTGINRYQYYDIVRTLRNPAVNSSSPTLIAGASFPAEYVVTSGEVKLTVRSNHSQQRRPTRIC
jgi:hypothetical protein